MIYIKSNDQAKIAVYDLNKSGKKTIVLVHGWPLSHNMFEYQLPTLLKAGYRIISMDIRGFGNSEETSDGYSYDQLAVDLYCVVKELKLDNFVLLGFSMGGAIVTRYMARYKGYGVSKLCLWSAAVPSYCKTARNPYGNSIDETTNLIELGLRDRPALNKYFGNLFFYKEHSKPFQDWLQRISDQASGIGQIKTLRSLRDEDVFDDLKHIHVPTGIFHGQEDKICPIGMAKITYSNIENAKLFIFKNAGHGAFYDSLQQFNTFLLRFLQGDV